MLTEERAADAGYVGAGPFTFGSLYPGEWLVDRPVRISALGFDTADDAAAAIDEAGVPLELVDVEPGTAEPVRVNHAPTREEAAAADVEQAVEEKAGGSIGSHAEADAVAGELGLVFPDDPRPRLADKIAAIERVHDGADAADVSATFVPPAEGEGV